MNLRAALFRFLAELKKKGSLARETVVRKTMLDDCKGDKFYELLADFSTTVVCKELRSAPQWIANPALKLSTANELTACEYQWILPLILANRVSLSAVGERRARVQATHDKFAQLLDNKKAEITDRSMKGNGHTAAQEQESMHPDLISREVKENWLGSEEWADTLLYGGSKSNTDAFLELTFSEAWHRANESTVEDLGSGPVRDLLVDLESRISHHQRRLRRWREFSCSIQMRDAPAYAGRSARGTDKSSLMFRDHQPLSVAATSGSVATPEGHATVKEEDDALLSSLCEALARINGKPVSHTIDTLLRQPLASPGMSEHPRASPFPSRRANRVPSPQVRFSSRVGSPSRDIATLEDDDYEQDKDNISPLPEPLSPQKFTLVERTRKSMPMVTPPNMRETHHHPQHPNRQLFPVSQFETPQKQSPNGSGTSTPPDDLFNEDADYASVFKSRPRVAQSPISSPAVHVSPFDEYVLNEDSGGSPWSGNNSQQNSPLFSRRRAR